MQRWFLFLNNLPFSSDYLYFYCYCNCGIHALFLLRLSLPWAAHSWRLTTVELTTAGFSQPSRYASEELALPWGPVSVHCDCLGTSPQRPPLPTPPASTPSFPLPVHSCLLSCVFFTCVFLNNSSAHGIPSCHLLPGRPTLIQCHISNLCVTHRTFLATGGSVHLIKEDSLRGARAEVGSRFMLLLW